jgi:hypothetical protein
VLKIILHKRTWRFLAGILLLAGAWCSAYAQARVPGQGRSITPLPPESQRDEGTKAPMPVFELHSGFWLNLHHVLYREARLQQQRTIRRPAGGPAETLPRAELSEAEKLAWEAGLSHYARAMAARDLAFDGDMVLIKNRLAEMGDCADLSGASDARCTSGLRPELIGALEKAAPVYRAKWWPAHDQRNRKWINALAPQVQKPGARLAASLSNLYHVDWPTARIRVEVSAYAGLLGSYTTLDPLTVTISSSDERTQGPLALELIFYEASHFLGLSAREIIARECRVRGKPIPRELWDAMLYYTVVMATRAGTSTPGSEPGSAVAERGWRSYRNVLDGFWKPFLQSSLRNQANPEDLERTIGRMIAAL